MADCKYFGRLIKVFAKSANNELIRRRNRNIPLRPLGMGENIAGMPEFAGMAYYFMMLWDEKEFLGHIYDVIRKPFNRLERSSYRELIKLCKYYAKTTSG